MRIENCVALLRAELKSTPAISHFEEIKPSARAVRRGDLFVAFDKSEIAVALENGAFGVVFDGEYESSDSEIAWIKVRDVRTAAFTLLRYLLLKKRFRYIVLDRVVFELAQQMAKDKRVYFARPNDVFALFENVLKSDEELIVASYDEDFLQHLTSDPVETVFAPKESEFALLNFTLFESTILYYGDPVKIRLPFFQLRYLDGALDFLHQNGLECSVQDVGFTPFFEPVFVDASLVAREFGRTSRAIVFTKYEGVALLREAVRYLCREASWAKKLFLLPIYLAGFEEEDAIITYYGGQEELVEILAANDFTYALVVDFDKTKVLQSKKESASLFD